MSSHNQIPTYPCMRLSLTFLEPVRPEYFIQTFCSFLFCLKPKCRTPLTKPRHPHDRSPQQQPGSSKQQGGHTSINSTAGMPRYKTPMKRKPWEPGLYPRTTPHSSSNESVNSDYSRPQRARRTRQPPAWMKSPDLTMNCEPYIIFRTWFQLYIFQHCYVMLFCEKCVVYHMTY